MNIFLLQICISLFFCGTVILMDIYLHIVNPIVYAIVYYFIGVGAFYFTVKVYED